MCKARVRRQCHLQAGDRHRRARSRSPGGVSVRLLGRRSWCRQPTSVRRLHQGHEATVGRPQKRGRQQQDPRHLPGPCDVRRVVRERRPPIPRRRPPPDHLTPRRRTRGHRPVQDPSHGSELEPLRPLGLCHNPHQERSHTAHALGFIRLRGRDRLRLPARADTGARSSIATAILGEDAIRQAQCRGRQDRKSVV